MANIDFLPAQAILTPLSPIIMVKGCVYHTGVYHLSAFVYFYLLWLSAFT